MNGRLLYSSAAFLILLHFFLGLGSARIKTTTADEYSYIATAYVYVNEWDFRLDRTHPPLIRLLIGIPLQFLDLNLNMPPRELWDTPSANTLGYVMGWDLLLRDPHTQQRILLSARIPVLLLSCALGLIVFLWARDAYGAWGGLISLTLYCICPNMVAHAGLATMDLGLSFFFIATLFSFHLYNKHGNLAYLISTAVLLGLALAAKVTALLLIPALLLALLFQPGFDTLSVRRSWIYFGRDFAILFGFACLALMLVYGFPFKPFYFLDTLSNVFSKSLQGGAAAEVPGMPHANYAFYLMGDYSTQGWPHYFLIALLVKTPLAVFFLLAVGLITANRRWYGALDILLLASLALLLIASMFNRVNIGLRHILPVYPLLYIYLGRSAQLMERRWGQAILLVLGIWYAAANLYIHPDYLAYFNEAAGGPKRGHEWLDDSNIDWGQDLGGLVEVRRQYPNESFYVATNWMFRPQGFGLDAEMLESEQIRNPPQGIVAVGKHWAIRKRMHRRAADYFDWLEKYNPIAEIGGSIWIFRFSDLSEIDSVP